MYFILGLIPQSFPLVACCLALTGFLAGFFMVPLQTMTQILSTEEQRGRVLGNSWLTWDDIQLSAGAPPPEIAYANIFRSLRLDDLQQRLLCREFPDARPSLLEARTADAML
jgi:hypothetical protein